MNQEREPLRAFAEAAHHATSFLNCVTRNPAHVKSTAQIAMTTTWMGDVAGSPTCLSLTSRCLEKHHGRSPTRAQTGRSVPPWRPWAHTALGTVL